jgi:hypothetical protein
MSIKIKNRTTLCDSDMEPDILKGIFLINYCYAYLPSYIRITVTAVGMLNC